MRLLLVDDDEVLVDALANHLIAQRYAVDIATDGEEAWEYIALFNYDLVVLDVMLPQVDGISLCKKIRDRDYSMPVLMLTARDRSTDIVEGFNAGADDYLVKPFNFDELTVRIHALLRREAQALTSVLKWGNLSLDLNSLEVIYDEKPLNLTAKEYALLELFLRNHKRVFSLDGIIESLWSFEEPPTEGAVRTHIKTLRQKLTGAGAAKDLIETVYGIGYRLKPLPDSTEKQTETESNSAAQSPAPEIAAVWMQHKEAMSARLAVLENVANALKEDNFNKALKPEAILAAHKLAGSLGSLGFEDGSKLARKLEDFLTLETFSQAEQIEPFNKLVNNLRDKFDRYEPGSSSVLDSFPLLLIVDNDRDFTGQLATQAAANNFRTAIATTASEAREIIQRDRPAIVLLRIFQIRTKTDRDSPIDSLDLLAQLHQQMPLLPIVVIVSEAALFNTNKDFTERLKIMRGKKHTLLVQPITPTQAMDAVSQLLRRSGAEAKITIVDDDSLFLEVMQTSLKPWGFEITTLNDPRQFWQVLQVTSPDLLILDVEMPDVNGIELCRMLRSDSNWSHLPVLFLTAHQDLQTQERAFYIGADDYISKPVAGTQLATRILNRLSRIRTIQSKTPNS
ncbi:multi-component transcriptional regulator, winged helix family (plasmid) [Stanieria cyanosphaera PCC 7437]|uniref:Multi-component transcriptional regulator, winged helix family n=1 Tax=Stanieria cyanosphaera (strain ATCC 29371 / PCC 7437) TaxID=111780 RepID=K9Y056_STAC7|nr:response regulator [Stanieria cyanosphaera]AFZ38128.1 multi-component transcriptional regulator, winged helix family [Stanieria cyanosphaera PCC 7437]